MILLLHYFKIAFLMYAGMISLLFLFQRNLIFFPDKSVPRQIEGAKIIHVQTEDKLTLHGAYIPPEHSDNPVIVYFHGNGGNISHRLFKIRAYLRLGYGVLLAEYRGYGANAGKPSESGFYKDADAYMNFIINEQKVTNIILYGESIGSGVAVQMATKYKTKGLILEAPFSSLVDIAAEQYPFVPVRLLLRDRFDNIKKIGKIDTSLMILHGQNDTVVPYESGKKLFDAAIEPKKFIEFPKGDHNNLYEFAAADYVIKFVEQVCRN